MRIHKVRWCATKLDNFEAPTVGFISSNMGVIWNQQGNLIAAAIPQWWRGGADMIVTMVLGCSWPADAGVLLSIQCSLSFFFRQVLM